MRRLLWIAMLSMAMAGWLSSPAACCASTRCPWLNAATAGGVLGGEVQVDLTPPTVQGDLTCEFSRGQGSSAYKLHIAVHTMQDPSKEFKRYLSRCDGQRVPLKAIGNEAVQCVLKNSSTVSEEQVIGRVRERVFILTLMRYASASPNAGLSEDARNLAEQVAGNLF